MSSVSDIIIHFFYFLEVISGCLKKYEEKPLQKSLHLIQSYLSGSDNSEVEDESDLQLSSISKTLPQSLARLPVPECILSWQGAKHHEVVCDDPSQHDGRTRSFKHERGNWPTLIYIEYLGNDVIRSWLSEVPEKLGFGGGMKTFSEFHLSLTRSLVLKFHWIESFVDSVKSLCQSTARTAMELGDLKVYCNEERTRTFLGLQCNDRSKNIHGLVTNLDKLLAEYQLPSFYEEASFHVSVLWSLGDEEKSLSAWLPVLNESLNKIYTEHPLYNRIEIDYVTCKIGNKIYTFNLK